MHGKISDSKGPYFLLLLLLLIPLCARHLCFTKKAKGTQTCSHLMSLFTDAQRIALHCLNLLTNERFLDGRQLAQSETTMRQGD